MGKKKQAEPEYKSKSHEDRAKKDAALDADRKEHMRRRAGGDAV